MEKDLSKPFVNVYREELDNVIEINSPNDQIGDFAFEWDFDGSERKKWEEHLQDLEAQGIRGDLSYKKAVFKYNPAFDNSDFENNGYPLESYKMILHDYNE